MLTASDLATRLTLGEDDLTEFKSLALNDFTIEPRVLAKAIVALANGRGGHLILGVDDDGSVSGTGSRAQTDAVLVKVSQVCRDTIKPPLVCATAKLDYNGSTVLVVEVPAHSSGRPYKANSVYYLRDGAQSREATGDELRRLLESTDFHYDEGPVHGATFADLDPDLIGTLLEQFLGADMVEELLPDRDDLAAVRRYLVQLKCLTVDGTPTVAGYLVVGRQPLSHLLDARISAVAFPGVDLGDEFADRADLHGDLTSQIRGALAFVERNLRAPTLLGDAVRHEAGLPAAVLREAVSNAVVHRDYRFASQIRLFVFADRMELQNPGELLNRLTLANIRLGLSQQRNPVLSSLMNRLGRRESLGIGIPRMLQLMRKHGLPAPEFALEGGHFKLTLRLAPEAPRHG